MGFMVGVHLQLDVLRGATSRSGSPIVTIESFEEIDMQLYQQNMAYKDKGPMGHRPYISKLSIVVDLWLLITISKNDKFIMEHRV